MLIGCVLSTLLFKHMWFVSEEFVDNVFQTSQSSFVFRQLNGLMYCDVTLITQFNISYLQFNDFKYKISEPGSNSIWRDNHIPQSSRTGALPSDGHIRTLICGEEGFLSLCRDRVCVFYSSNRLGFKSC